jgi:hypothetical protein
MHTIMSLWVSIAEIPSRIKEVLSDERGEIAMDVIVVGMLVSVLVLMSAPIVYLALTSHAHH